MSAATRATAIAAAKAKLAAAPADVGRLTAQIANEQTAGEPAGPRLATAADGVAAAKRRHPGRTRSQLPQAAARTR